MPVVSVLMPVYNAEEYLRESIESILSQTFGDFEFLIINDGSTDNSAFIISSYSDERIRFVDRKHFGISNTLNYGLKLAQGEYIARMDADDISLPQRLEKQVECMNKHKNIDVVGSYMAYLNSTPLHVVKYPIKNKDIKAEFLFTYPFSNPTMMYRREKIKNKKFFYRENKAEDYDLMSRMINKFIMANLPVVLLYYRVGVGISGKFFKQEFIDYAKIIRKRVVLSFFGHVNKAELDFHSNILTCLKKDSLFLINDWFNKLRLLNKKKGNFKTVSLDNAFARRWFSIVAKLGIIDIFFDIWIWRQSFKYFLRADFKNKLSNIKLLLVSFKYQIWPK